MLISLLTKLASLPLFRRKPTASSTWDIISWWESRRIPYNIILVTTGITFGIIILATAYVCDRVLGDPIGLPDPPFFAIVAAIAYVIMANVCYTGGWVLELLSRRIWGARAHGFGEIAFTWGTLGSVALTLSPAGLIVLVAVYRLARHGIGR